MIDIEVKVYAPFTKKTGQSLIRVELNEGAKVHDLVVRLLEIFPELDDTQQERYDPDWFMREALLLKGETIVQMHDPLQDGDRVHMLPAIVSG